MSDLVQSFYFLRTVKSCRHGSKFGGSLIFRFVEEDANNPNQVLDEQVEIQNVGEGTSVPVYFSVVNGSGKWANHIGNVECYKRFECFCKQVIANNVANFVCFPSKPVHVYILPRVEPSNIGCSIE